MSLKRRIEAKPLPMNIPSPPIDMRDTVTVDGVTYPVSRTDEEYRSDLDMYGSAVRVRGGEFVLGEKPRH